MTHIVNTSVAAVKISGSFSAPDFSASEEEDEIPAVRRPRSNAVSESPLSSVDANPRNAACSSHRKTNQLVSNYEHGEIPNSVSNCSCASEMSISDVTAMSCPHVSASHDNKGQSEQKVHNSNTRDTRMPSIDDSNSVETNKTSLTNNGSAGVPGLNTETTHVIHKDRDPSQNLVTMNSSDVCDHSPVSSQENLASSSSPVMVKKVDVRGHLTSGNQSSASAASSVSSSREMYHQSRFNPFDRDIHLEEDHFSDNPESNLFGRGNSPRPSASSHSSDQWNGGGSSFPEDSDSVTFAELGLAEDHFAHLESHFGFSQTEELDMAIDNCKALIRKATPDSERQKKLVQTLVQLRLKLQELKEEPVVHEKNVISVLGHRLQRKESRSTKYYCEKCNAVIWGLVQEWRKCQDCGYRCHDKCVSQITRNCAMVKVKENGTFIMELCPRHPRGLQAQDYRCAECKAQLLVAEGSEPRLCEYNGRYYCELCHWNDVMYIPAQILLNWDFEKQKVCRASKQYLKLMMRRAVIKVGEVNPSLFNYVEQLADIKTLREELLMMKKYILACPAAMQAKLLLQLSGRPHFVECSDRYSLQDLLDSDDSLIPELVQVHSSWAQHIKTDCELCQGRGYYCELCTSKEVLFPFDNIAVTCSSCSSVMHRVCFSQHVTCPKCDRRRKRQEGEEHHGKS